VSATSYAKSLLPTASFAQGWCWWKRWNGVARSVHKSFNRIVAVDTFLSNFKFLLLYFLSNEALRAVRRPCGTGVDTALTGLSTRNIFQARVV